MPPKAKKGGGKSKKSAKPSWMTEEMYALSTNLAKCQEYWCGEVKESKGKGKDGKPLPEFPNVPKEQAGRFMWQMLFPNSKEAKARREECIKLGVVDTCVVILAKGKPEEITPALGIVACLADFLDPCRLVFLDAKPSPLPSVLKALEAHDSAPLRTAACQVLRVLVSKEDSRPRVWKALKDWDWTPLLECLSMQDMSALGGRNAALDCATALATLCSAPELPAAEGACTAVVTFGGLPRLVALLSDRVSHPMTRAASLSVLYAVCRRSPMALAQDVLLTMGALGPTIKLLDHPIIPLISKAHAAAIMLRFVMPDRLWRDSAVLAQPAKKGKEKKPVATAAGSEAMPSIADASGTAAAASAAADAAAGAPGAMKASAEDAAAGFEAAVPDGMLLDDATRSDVLSRARMLAEAGAVRPLVWLCAGPEGPMEDLEAKAEAEAATAAAAAADGAEAMVEVAEGDGKKKGKKGKKGKGKKGKKGKLEPGMAEAQTFCSAVLRLVSMDERWRSPLVACGAVRYLLPLLDVKLSPARWNARQLLINLSLSPSLMPTLALYKVPDYVHGGNVPGSHYDRPFTADGDDLESLPAHLAEPRAAAAAARAKPPPLKVGAGGRAPSLLQVHG